MRFPASPPKQPLRNVAAAEPMSSARADAGCRNPLRAVAPGPLPTALDERVRLVGEW